MADTTSFYIPPRRDPILSKTAYPAVRLSMFQDHVMMDDAAVESLLSDLFPDSHPDDVENFAQIFRNVAKTVAPIAQRALPGVIQGASSGMMVGGPYGALFGALGGGAISALSGGGQAPPPARTATPPARNPAVAAPTPRASAPFLGPTTAVTATGANASQVAAAQLLALLSRPETLQALMALAMQAQGRRTVPVGRAQIPARALANALSDLAAVAGHDASRVQDGLSDGTDDGGADRGEARVHHNIAIFEAFAAAPWSDDMVAGRPYHNRRHQ